MDAIRVLRTLRAVRRYADRPLPPAALADILDAARWTGSAKNRQPWEVVVVTDRAALAALAACGPYAGHLPHAPCGIALLLDAGEAHPWFDEGRLAQSIMVAAWAHGVGSCIASIYPEDNAARARALLGVPEDRLLHTVIAFGFPADPSATRLASAPAEVRAAVTPGRMEAERFVSWERYGRRRAGQSPD